MRRRSRSLLLWPVALFAAGAIGAAVIWPSTAAAEGGDGGGGGSGSAGGGGAGSGSTGGAAGHGSNGSGHSSGEDGSGSAGSAPSDGTATSGAAGSGSAPGYDWTGSARDPAALSLVPQFEQDRAREALRRGWVLPLGNVLANVRKSVPGDVLDVRLKHESDGEWVYALMVLTPDGRYRDVAVDAKSCRILWIKGR
jgi:hypothetical protein